MVTLYDLVKQRRDVKPGLNKLITLEEVIALKDSSGEKNKQSLRNKHILIFTDASWQYEALKKEGVDFINTKSFGWSEFVPPNLVNKISNADLVVVPSYLIKNIKKEVPDAKIAVLLEESKDITVKLQVPAINENYPRILIKDEKGHRIDEKTIELLFKRYDDELRHPHDLDTFLGEDSWKGGLLHSFLNKINYSHKLDSFFYDVIKKNMATYINPVERTTIKVQGLKSKTLPAGDRVIIANYYGMGARQNGAYLRRKNSRYGYKTIEELRRAKIEEIISFYDKLLTQPLNSIEDILDRQKLMGNLIENPTHFNNVRSLELILNKMYEPFVHLSNMSRLIGANILHSKWGGKISKKEFFKDYMRLTKTFVDSYEQIKATSSSIKVASNEMGDLLTHLSHLMDDNSKLDNSYKFLKGLLNANPKNYFELYDLFKAELERRKAKKLDNLESYNYRMDEAPHQKKNINPNKSLKGFKSRRLLSLLEKFHSQFPVVEAENTVMELDWIGSKLAAYTALAEFFRGNKWVKPEILPEERGIVDIKYGWYPLMESDTEVVKNNTYLDSNEKIEILEGVNKGGKTVDLKKTLFIVILALAGGYVPAESARISFFDRVRYRIKQTGMYEEGAFEEEVKNIGEVLSALVGSSAIIGIDEAFTSTNPKEGEALNYGLIKRLLKEKSIRAIITSHYPTLHDILNDPEINGVKFSHFPFEATAEGLYFPHKKINGLNPRRDYAIPIARYEKIPKKIINYAIACLNENGNA